MSRIYEWNADDHVSEDMIESLEGNYIPAMKFPIRVRDETVEGDNPYRWDTFDLVKQFKGKRVVVFSLPGAFTPTCSTYQVPGFEENADKIKSYGIEDIYCISVNDTFVMNAWAKSQNLQNVKVIPDGTGEFTDSMGMLVDKANLGFGLRSWRYAMIISNGQIQKIFVEPGISNNCEEDPYGETSPEKIIEWLQAEKDADNAMRIANGEGPVE